MDHYLLTVFLAKIIGITFIVVAMAVFLNQDIYTSVAKRIAQNPLILCVVGAMDLVAGLAIVLAHNDWVYNWTVLVTIIGWLLFIRGTVRLVFPRWILRTAAKFERRFRWILCAGALCTLLYGGALLYFSWMVNYL
jgi:hypothetical protein